MKKKRSFPLAGLITFILFFITYILHYTPFLDISIGSATPLGLLPLLTAFAIFSSPEVSAVVGLFVGIAMDAVASGATCLNAIFMLLAAAAVSLISNNLFNRNIRAAVLLSVLVSLAYYLVRWLVFYAFRESVQDNTAYLLGYVFPSMLYTSALIFIFYPIYNYFYKIKNNG